MYQDQVFCFTPKGDLIALPQGSVPIDFAYAVHSEIGDTCVGAKINSRLVPLQTQLKNGDQVEIVTSKTSTPSPTWEQFRSEEHTSELQSLMRISYAVFCLKKKQKAK